MFCSVRQHWKAANQVAIAFACISACQNISFAAQTEKSNSIHETEQANRYLNKSNSSSPSTQTRLVGLEAQATALTLEPTNAPSAKTAPEMAIKTKVSATSRTDGSNSKSKVFKPIPVQAQESSNQPNTTTKSAVSEKSTTSKSSVSETTKTPKSAMTAQTTKTSKSAAPGSNDQSKSTGKSTSKTGTENESNTTTKTTKRKPRKQSVGLVPPPPPTIPTYLNGSPTMTGTFDLGLPVNFMSLDDLKFQQKNLEKKLEATKLDDVDQKRSTKEKQERAERFTELFKEGVVSRRELESAHEESERSTRALEQSHIKVSEIDRVLGQVKERISSMEAAKRPFKVSSKKSKPGRH